MFADQITLNMKAIGGKAPYVWTYLRMPEELEGDKNGVITGYFDIQGRYSFGVNCADSNGKSTDYFITINIQPMTFFGAYTIAPVYVKSMYPPEEYDLDALNGVQRDLNEDFKRIYDEA